MLAVGVDTQMAESSHGQVDFLCFSSIYGDTIEIPHISREFLQLGEIDIASVSAPGRRYDMVSFLLEAVYFSRFST